MKTPHRFSHDEAHILSSNNNNDSIEELFILQATLCLSWIYHADSNVCLLN